MMTEQEARQLDAEVAREVMGWAKRWRGGYYDYHDGEHWRDLPPFSTDLDAAEVVLARMADLGGLAWEWFSENLYNCLGEHTSGNKAYTLELFLRRDNKSELICRCALDAVRIEVENRPALAAVRDV